MNILRTRCSGDCTTRSLGRLQQLETIGDSVVAGVQFGSSSVRVDGIGDLIIATFVETAEVKPHFRDVRVDADRPGVRVKSVSILIDLKV